MVALALNKMLKASVAAAAKHPQQAAPKHGGVTSAHCRPFKRWATVSLPLFTSSLQEYPQSGLQRNSSVSVSL